MVTGGYIVKSVILSVKKNTMTKHVKTKHSQFIKWYICGEMDNSKDSLQVHKEKVHEEGYKDTSFVFSKSMLDESL